MTENKDNENVIVIPQNATLQEVIEILNFCELTVKPTSNDPIFQKWLYNHKHWIKTGDE